MSVGPGSFIQEPSAQECRRIVNMKVEPEQKRLNEAIGIHTTIPISSKLDLGFASEMQNSEKDGQEGNLRQILLQKISDDGHTKIANILNEIQTLSDVELISLYLNLPSGQSPSDPSMHGGGLALNSPSVHLSNQLEQSQAFTWIRSHLEEDASTCLRKDEVYEDYRSYCDNHSMKCLNTADFGKVMKRAFPNVKPRRLGQRGQSKYCYGGLRKRLEVQPPYLPDLDPLQSDKLSGNERQGGPDTNQNIPPGESMLSECIALVLEWVEKLLGRQFITLRQLAEYLVLNMYVNSRSCAAFALVADVHNRQGQPSSKIAQSPRISQDVRRKSVSSRDSESLPRLPSPRSDTSRVKASGSASSDTSTPPSAPFASHANNYSDIPTSVPSAHLQQYSNTPPAASTSHLISYSNTPPAPSSHHQQYANTPPSTHVQQYANTPPQAANHLQQYSHTPPGHPSTHFQPYSNTPSVHHVPAMKPNLMQLPSSIKPQSAHSALHPTIPMRAFPGYPTAQTSYGGDSYRPPPPLQYGGGTYTPQRVGKRPYEMTTQEYYSPYYPYADSNPKRNRYDPSVPAYNQQQSTSSNVQSIPSSPYCPPTPQYQPPPSAAPDPYSTPLGMLSPRSHSQPPQRNSLGPRLGPSPAPSGTTVQTRPKVGRSPSPLQFTNGPPTTGVRRPSPVRASPGHVSSQESPESGGSIHLPRSPTSPFRSLPKRLSNSEPRRRTSREFDFTDGRPTSSSVSEEQKVTSTVGGFAESIRNQDLHTPTPPTGPEYLFVDTSAQGTQSGSGLTPPTAFL